MVLTDRRSVFRFLSRQDMSGGAYSSGSRGHGTQNARVYPFLYDTSLQSEIGLAKADKAHAFLPGMAAFGRIRASRGGDGGYGRVVCSMRMADGRAYVPNDTQFYFAGFSLTNSEETGTQNMSIVVGGPANITNTGDEYISVGTHVFVTFVFPPGSSAVRPKGSGDPVFARVVSATKAQKEIDEDVKAMTPIAGNYIQFIGDPATAGSRRLHTHYYYYAGVAMVAGGPGQKIQISVARPTCRELKAFCLDKSGESRDGVLQSTDADPQTAVVYQAYMTRDSKLPSAVYSAGTWMPSEII